MAKATSLTISGVDLYAGMQDSSYLGVADIRNLDITSTPGLIKIAPLLTKESSNIIIGLIKYWDVDPATGTVWAIDTSGNGYKRVAGTWSTVSALNISSCIGLKVWKNYVFITRNVSSTTTVTTYGPLSGSPAAVTWQTLNNVSTNLNAPMFVGKNDILYFASNQYIGQTTEVAGKTFDPTDSSTYIFSDATVSNAKLLLASKYNIIGMAQVGTRMYIGVQLGSLSLGSIPIFPWDMVSSLPDVPITIGQPSIQQITETNNLLYINAGVFGNISVSNGSSVQEIKRLNQWNASPLDGFQISPTGIDSFNNGVLIGLGKTATADNVSPVGVFFYKDKGGKDKAWCYFIPSHGFDGSANQAVQVGAILGGLGLISWFDGTNYGVDRIDNTRCYQNYSAYFTSPLWQINQVLDKTALTRVEFKFAKPLVSSQGLKIEYRECVNDSWTTLGIWDYATYSATRNGYFTFGYSKPELQIKVSLTTGSSNNDTPELIYVTVF